MASANARYDPVAEWYVDFTRHWGSEPLAPLPDDVRGQRVLDLGCGYGVVSRYLAGRSAVVTGIDLSANLLAMAAEAEARQPLGIRYVHADATRTDWWDGEPFDGVVCNMALMDIDDLDGALSTAAGVLGPDGWFSFSIFHPCYPGGGAGSADPSPVTRPDGGDPHVIGGLPSWAPDRGYSSEGWWTTKGSGVRGQVGANHRTVSTYLNAVLRAGLEFEEFAEPPFTVPLYLVARARKPATAGT